MRLALAALLLSVVAVAAACSTAPSSQADSAHTLNVLGGSELKDLGPVLADFEKSSGDHVALKYVGSLDGAQPRRTAVLCFTPRTTGESMICCWARIRWLLP